MSRLINLILMFLPTIYFVMSVFFHTLIGYKRGLRRSLSFLYRTLIVFGIYLTIYLLLINLSIVDKGLLNLVNLFLGQNGLQNVLGVSSTCSSIKDCLVEFVPTIMGDNVYSTALYDNGAYIRTIVSMFYNLFWFLIIYILYGITLFIVKRVYCHKHRYKDEKDIYFLEVAHNNVPHKKSKGRLGGSLVGLGRGIVSSVIVLSLFGNILFIVSGGKGQNKDDDTITLDTSVDPYIKMYQSISNYGEYGIYSVLNAISDKQNVPFYLYITDVVFHGQINDEENSFYETVSLRNELASITSFASRGTKLLFHYGGQEFKDIIMGRDTSKTVLDEIISLYSLEAFQNDFNKLLDELDLNSYVFNFAFGFAQSFLGNCDEPTSPLNTLPEDTKELLKICFKKGYKSSVIPYESDYKGTLPYLSPSVLVSSCDVKYIFEMFTKIYTFTGRSYEENDINKTLDTISLIKELLPSVKQLSILKTNEKDKINPILSRIYAFAEVKYLAAPDEENKVESIKRLNNVSSLYGDIDWISELNSLLDVSEDILTSYNDALVTLNNAGEDLTNVPLIILQIAKSPTYMEVVNNFCDSYLLQSLMKTSLVEYYIEETLATLIQTTRDNIVLPDDISYVDQGETRGETYKILSLMNLFATSEDIVPSNDGDIKLNVFIKKLIKGEISDQSDIVNLLKVKNAKDSSKRSDVTNAILDSSLFRSTISNYIFNNEEGINDSFGFELVIPNSSCEFTSDKKRCNIKYDEFNAILSVVEKANLDSFSSSDINEVLSEFKKVRTEFSTSEILRGSLSKYLTENDFENFKIIIPSKAKIDGVLTSDELNYFFDFIDLVEVDKLSSEDTNYLLEVLVENKNLLFSSQVLKATISNYIRPIDGSSSELTYNGFSLIVPNTSLNNENYITDNEYEILVEFISFIKEKDISVLSENEILTLIYNNEKNSDIKFLNSKIINASMVNFLLDNSGFSSYIPEDLDREHQGNKDNLYNFTSSNPWFNEMRYLINGLAEICYENEEINLSKLNETYYLKNDVISNLLNSPISTSSKETKLDVIYDSVIIKNKVTTILDDSLDNSSEMIKEGYLDECKEGGLYNKEELRSILKFLNEYDIEIDDFETFDFASLLDKNSNKYLLNNSKVDGSKTKLELIYDSTLLKLLVSDKLDEYIKDNINDFIKVETYLKTKYTPSLKYNVYDVDELKNTLECLERLGIDFSSEGYYFNGASILKQLYNDETKLNSIYSSKIVIGVVTKYLSDYLRDENIFSSNIIDHPYAYSDFIKYHTKSFYKQEEIDNLFKLLKDERLPNITFDESADTYEIDFTKDKINLSAITELFYNETNTFYLLDGYISNTLMNLGSLIIPSSSCENISLNSETKIYVKHDDIKALLNALDKLDLATLASFESIKDSIKIREEDFTFIIASSILKNSLFTKDVTNEDKLFPDENKASKKQGFCYGEKELSYYIEIKDSEIKSALTTLLYLSTEVSGTDYISFSIIEDLTINDIIDLYKKDDDKFISNVTSSSLVYNLTSDIILSYIEMYASYIKNGNTEKKTVWDIKSISKIYNNEVIKQDSLITTLDTLKNFL